MRAVATLDGGNLPSKEQTSDASEKPKAREDARSQDGYLAAAGSETATPRKRKPLRAAKFMSSKPRVMNSVDSNR